MSKRRRWNTSGRLRYGSKTLLSLTLVGAVSLAHMSLASAEDDAAAPIRLEHDGWQISGTMAEQGVIHGALLTRGPWRVSAQIARIDAGSIELQGTVRASSRTSYLTTSDARVVDDQLVTTAATVFVDDWQLRAARISIDLQSDRLELQYPGADTDHRQRMNAPEE